jgi:hypothetical protein
MTGSAHCLSLRMGDYPAVSDPHDKPRIGVYYPSAYGLAVAVADGLKANNNTVEELYPDRRWPDDLHAIIIPGPMDRLGPVVNCLQQMTVVPPTAVWYSEQIPDPRLPVPLVSLLASGRWHLDQRLDGSALFDHSLPDRDIRRLAWKGRRLGLLGEMKYLHRQGWLRLIAAFTSSNAHFFQEHQLPAEIIPMGYDRSFGEPLNCERDIDVLFLGSLRDKRRREIFRTLEPRFAAAGIRYVIRDGSSRRGYAFGVERTLLLNRSRIMLNIMRQPWDDAVFRMLLAAPNGCMLLSEPLLDSEPFRHGEHLVTTTLPAMLDSVRYYLEHDGERQRVADCAYQFVTTNLTMKQMVERLLARLGASLGGPNTAERGA